ncbi:PepSY domain-containing protein [Aquabacterium sp. A7-Y]|uniref:PepSY-associated TM helix domain-containing protein n=1 Tax=Aquabacterium sp. A7-Y TaxID=1349605 RepID=UPI00223D43CE|nr:PepSY domain-containing protein [Aquabacterium sp. A7-Y]MCW7536769.1 PepSY domain-containing protein [Aquabacterium sp. A7-Y]
MNSASVDITLSREAALRRLFWRLHFWAGLLGAPILLFAAVTGLIYVVSPQVEAALYAELDRVAVRQARLPLDAQVAAVQAAHPHAELRHVVPAHGPADSTQVYLRPPHAAQAMHGDHSAAHGARPAAGNKPTLQHDHGLPTGSIVYVDPYTGQVLGQLQEMQRFKTWAKKLHSSVLQGDGWRWLLELGASWMLVLFATGLTLWWPRAQSQGGPGWRALLPRWGRGRRTWRDLHATVAIALGLVLSVVLITGLTWTRYSGENFRVAQEALGQATPKPPPSLRSAPAVGREPLGWQAVYDLVRAQAPDVSMQLTPPITPDGTWRVENFDRSQPRGRFTRVVDAYSGQTLFASGWNELPLLSRATAVGIPFHRGEFGLWNQVLLALAALAALFSVVSGLVMWWSRRPRGTVAVPRLELADVHLSPRWLWPVAAALAWAMPVFGWSLLALLTLEGLRLLVLRGSDRTVRS